AGSPVWPRSQSGPETGRARTASEGETEPCMRCTPGRNPLMSRIPRRPAVLVPALIPVVAFALSGCTAAAGPQVEMEHSDRLEALLPPGRRLPRGVRGGHAAAGRGRAAGVDRSLLRRGAADRMRGGFAGAARAGAGGRGRGRLPDRRAGLLRRRYVLHLRAGR